jgi:hypothetical protein
MVAPYTENKRLSIVAKGKIHTYVELSSMFAFARRDSTRNHLLPVSDHVNEKSLCLVEQARCLKSLPATNLCPKAHSTRSLSRVCSALFTSSQFGSQGFETCIATFRTPFFSNRAES